MFGGPGGINLKFQGYKYFMAGRPHNEQTYVEQGRS